MNSTRHLHYGWVIIGTACVVVFGCLGLARFGYGMVLPSMKAGLHLTNTQAGAVATADLVSYLAMAMLGGALASRFGPRIVIATALALTALGMAATGLSQGVWSAAAARILTGMGSGASNVPVMGMLAAWTAPRRRGLAAGIAVSGSSIGLIALGPIVPKLLNAFGADGWRVAWFVFAAVTLIIAVAAWLLLRDKPADIALQPLGSDTTAGDEEGAAARPKAQWRDVIRSGAVWHLGAVYTAFGFSYIIYMTFFVERLVSEAGYTHAAAGRLFMLMGVFSLACGVLWGSISDRIGRRWALTLIYLMHAASFALFAAGNGQTMFVVSALLFGFSAWSIPAVMAAACGDVTGPRLAPATLGFITLFFGIGQAAGPAAAGVLSDAAGSLVPALWLAAGGAVLGAVGSAFIRKAA